MDTARQVLRFSIPGSVTLLLAMGFLIIGRLLQGDSWDDIALVVRGNVSAVVAIFASIPLGFVIYQIYYASYRVYVWPWPWRWARGMLWVRIDRGAQILKGLPLTQRAQIEMTFDVELDLERRVLKEVDGMLGKAAHAYVFRLEFLEEAKANRERAYDFYKRRWQKHWNVVRALVEICEAYPEGSAIRSEYTVLSDLYHALGACRTGVQLAWFVSTLACFGYVVFGGSFWGSLLAVAVTFGLGAIIFFVFHRTRGNTWASAQAAMTFGLKGLFRRHPELLSPAG